jgi:hypothetical protein
VNGTEGRASEQKGPPLSLTGASGGFVYRDDPEGPLATLEEGDARMEEDDRESSWRPPDDVIGEILGDSYRLEPYTRNLWGFEVSVFYPGLKLAVDVVKPGDPDERRLKRRVLARDGIAYVVYQLGETVEPADLMLRVTEAQAHVEEATHAA